MELGRLQAGRQLASFERYLQQELRWLLKWPTKFEIGSGRTGCGYSHGVPSL